jgi:hypothetical protein
MNIKRNILEDTDKILFGETSVSVIKLHLSYRERQRCLMPFFLMIQYYIGHTYLRHYLFVHYVGNLLLLYIPTWNVCSMTKNAVPTIFMAHCVTPFKTIVTV